MCVCSCTVVVYVLGLDIAALWRSAAVTRGNIFHWFSSLRGYAGVQLGIPILMLFEDLLMALTIAFVCLKFCLRCARLAMLMLFSVLSLALLFIHFIFLLVSSMHRTMQRASWCCILWLFLCTCLL